MEISEYENIEIFNKTQSFSINKCENQILSYCPHPIAEDQTYLKSQITK